jgi:hypothetical protein
VAKRKCGTCKYFHDKGLASSGWCRHPARCDIQDMVLVRKAELACRNKWDRDLWEQAGVSSEPTGDVDTGQPVIPDPSYDAQQPLQRADFPPAAVHALPVSEGRELYTDKITAIGMRMAPPHPPSDAVQSPSMQPTAHRNGSDLSPEESRLAVREARRKREEARKIETRHTKATIVREAGDLLDGGASRETSAPIPTGGESPKSSHVPTDSGSPATRLLPVLAPVARKDQVIEPGSTVEFPAEPRRFAPSRHDVVSARHDDHSVTLPKALQDRSRRDDQGTAPLPDLGLRPKSDVATPTPPSFRGSLRGPGASPQRSATSQSDAPSVTGAGSPGKTDIRTNSSPYSTYRVPLDMPAALERDPIDTVPAASSVPRCCETCRDFKRVGDGNSGWCANSYAFPERRKVQAQDLACRSSVGVWWLPHDDLWLERSDITHHGRPTPILDEEFGTSPVSRQGMGPRSS